MTTKVACPSCGTDSYLDDLSREPDAFCRVCDYPLFWSRGERVTGNGDGGDAGLRRLPGTAGRIDVATIDCPVCQEPNPFARDICIRCGSELRPAPAPPPEPETEAVPVVDAEEHRQWAWWLWVAFAAAVGAYIGFLVSLLGH